MSGLRKIPVMILIDDADGVERQFGPVLVEVASFETVILPVGLNPFDAVDEEAKKYVVANLRCDHLKAVFEEMERKQNDTGND